MKDTLFERRFNPCWAIFKFIFWPVSRVNHAEKHGFVVERALFVRYEPRYAAFGSSKSQLKVWDRKFASFLNQENRFLPRQKVDSANLAPSIDQSRFFAPETCVSRPNGLISSESVAIWSWKMVKNEGFSQWDMWDMDFKLKSDFHGLWVLFVKFYCEISISRQILG